MPRKSSTAANADLNAATGGVVAVDRALSLLDVFNGQAALLTPADMAERTGLSKSTTRRMIASLTHARLLQKQEDGRYSVGPAVARLHQAYITAFSSETVVMPVLQALSQTTQESAAYYVRQGNQRICLYRVDSPLPVRDQLKAGDILPLNRGGGGRILTAFGDADDPLSRKIRREMSVIVVGDRMPELSSIAAPVFGADGQIKGALAVVMPTERMNRAYLKDVLAASRKLTHDFGGVYPA